MSGGSLTYPSQTAILRYFTLSDRLRCFEKLPKFEKKIPYTFESVTFSNESHRRSNIFGIEFDEKLKWTYFKMAGLKKRFVMFPSREDVTMSETEFVKYFNGLLIDFLARPRTVIKNLTFDGSFPSLPEQIAPIHVGQMAIKSCFHTLSPDFLDNFRFKTNFERIHVEIKRPQTYFEQRSAPCSSQVLDSLRGLDVDHLVIHCETVESKNLSSLLNVTANKLEIRDTVPEEEHTLDTHIARFFKFVEKLRSPGAHFQIGSSYKMELPLHDATRTFELPDFHQQIINAGGKSVETDTNRVKFRGENPDYLLAAGSAGEIYSIRVSDQCEIRIRRESHQKSGFLVAELAPVVVY